MGLTEEQVLSWLEENSGIDRDEVDVNTLLFSTSTVDSFDMIDLVGFVEEEAGVKFGPLDINLDNLDSVSRILAFANKTA